MSDTEEPVIVSEESAVVEAPAVTEVVEDVVPEETSAPVEAPAVEAPAVTEVVEDVVPEETSAPVVEAPVVEAPAVTEVVEDVVPEETSAPVPVAPSVPSTEEVVENVKEILTTEPVASSDTTELEERLKALEETLEKVIRSLRPAGLY